MASVYKKKTKSIEGHIRKFYEKFYGFIPNRLSAFKGALVKSHTTATSILLYMAILLGPYALAVLFMTKLDFFPLPAVGMLLLVTQTLFIVYFLIIRNEKDMVAGHAERKIAEKCRRKMAGAFETFDKDFYLSGIYGYDYTTAYHDAKAKMYDPEHQEVDDANVFEDMLTHIQGPAAMRRTGGITEPSDTPVIADYRVQIRYAHRPDTYRVYYADSYGPEEAERCFRKFLEDTKEDIITDCDEEGDLATMTGMEHEVYIDFFSGKSFHAVRCYVAEGVVDYDYSYAGAES